MKNASLKTGRTFSACRAFRSLHHLELYGFYQFAGACREAGEKAWLGRFRHRIPQACLGLLDDLLIVIGGDSLHIDACAFDACVMGQSLELDLNLFGLLRRIESEGE